MENLFYAYQGKVLFHVAGYQDNDNNVVNIIKALNAGARKLAGLISVDKKRVQTFLIEKSRRYKHMRVFFIENVESAFVPQGTYRIGADWTMETWLED